MTGHDAAPAADARAPRTRATGFKTQAAYYSATYPGAVVETRECADGVSFLHGVQDAGQWLHPETPQLLVSTILAHVTTGVFDLGSGRFAGNVVPGAFIVIPPDIPKRIEMHGRHEFRSLGLPYHDLLRGLGADCGLPPDGDFAILHRGGLFDRAVTRTMADLWRLSDPRSYGSRLARDGLVVALLGQLLSLQRRIADPRPRGGLAQWQIRRVTELLMSDLTRTVTLAELAASVDLSPFHFCRAFKVSLGTTPAQWHAERRLQHAIRLLATTALPIARIALEVGYASQAAFATAFRRYTGQTPSACRALASAPDAAAGPYRGG